MKNSDIDSDISATVAVTASHFVKSRGYLYGFRQPSLTYRFCINDSTASVHVFLACQWLRAMLGKSAADGLGALNETGSVVDFMLAATKLVLTASHHPVFSAAKVQLEGGTVSSPVYAIAQPCYEVESCKATVDFLTLLLNQTTSDQETTAELECHLAFDGLTQALATSKPPGFNTYHFLSAADKAGIPWLSINPTIVQLGHGQLRRWLSSSFTDKTSHLSAGLAGNKVLAAHQLRSCGMPVPEHELVTTADQAVKAAKKYGYPVVVKPADTEGGVGVSACLNDEAAVRDGYVQAAAYSRQILVEKFIHGKDYRFHVVDGKVVGVIWRAPGSVVGNGKSTLRLLVQQQNEQRATAQDDRRYLHPIHIDQDADRMVKSAGLTWETVIPEGGVVTLRGAANIASGGVPHSLELGQVHPDNLDLAVRAAAVLGLDVAGVDLLTPDIGCSWRSSGAAICEVNAQPQMLTTLHAPMLSAMFNEKSGRIPIIVVITDGSGVALSEALHLNMLSRQIACGLVNKNGTWAGSQQIMNAVDDVHTATQALLRNPSIEALVVSLSDSAAVRLGWPFDKCNVVVVDQAGIGAISKDTEVGKLLASALLLSPQTILQTEPAPDIEQGSTDPSAGAGADELASQIDGIIDVIFPSI